VAPYSDEDGKSIYLDLCDKNRTVMKISEDGIDSTTNPPVHFRRVQNTDSLPVPKGSKDGLQRLRKYTNMSDDHFALLLAFMVQCFNPYPPYPLLFLHGEQGSGKSTLTRMITDIVDPSSLDTRSLPSGQRDLVIAAENAWVLAFDNSSNLSPSLSDTLCRLSTESGFTTRTLYSDRGEEIFESARPVIINGIEQVIDRSDLMDRSLFVELQPISDDERQTEQELWSNFRRDRPHILGGLIWAIQNALHYWDKVDLDRKPRMADFAKWTVAAEPALPVEEGSIMEALRINQEDAARSILHENPLAVAILNLLKSRPDNTWAGTMEELRKAAFSHTPDDANDDAYPSNVQEMTARMKRVRPSLEKVGMCRSQNNLSRDNHRAFRLTLES
jgi:energy-coupling factor transporter ATP-binding protein EcfA2